MHIDPHMSATHTTHTVLIFLHLPAPPTLPQKHTDWNRASLSGQGCCRLSEHHRSRGRGQAGWVTSPWYVRKQQDSSLARKTITSVEHGPSVTLPFPFDFWFTELHIHYLSANWSNEAHGAVRQRGGEDQGSCQSVPLQAESEPDKILTLVEDHGSLSPTGWRFRQVYKASEVCNTPVMFASLPNNWTLCPEKAQRRGGRVCDRIHGGRGRVSEGPGWGWGSLQSQAHWAVWSESHREPPVQISAPKRVSLWYKWATHNSGMRILDGWSVRWGWNQGLWLLDGGFLPLSRYLVSTWCIELRP